MPFRLDVTLGRAIADGEEIELVHWSVDVGQYQYLSKGSVFAVARSSQGMGKLILNFECALLEPVAKTGDRLASDTVIAKAAADGELLPYNRPAAIFWLDDHRDS
ncbi:MAG TPA: hypothetical protein VIY49_18575 [Bryobacteraceae bacterium]